MQRPRLLDLATIQENHDRFLRRTVQHEAAWTVWGETGPLIVDSNDAPRRDVYLLFSDEAYARRALRESWPDHPAYIARQIPLFDLLHRWLPGLDRDGHLCGTNWTGDLIGLEVEPADLGVQLLERLPDGLKAEYRSRLPR